MADGVTQKKYGTKLWRYVIVVGKRGGRVRLNSHRNLVN